MDLTFRDNYWDDAQLKQEFIGFLVRIFNFDLTLWDKTGFWDKRFRPFSYFHDKKMVSSLCLYSLDMMVDGKKCLVGQVSSVATLEEYRRRGLNRQLTEKAIEWASGSHDFFFLFADEEAHPFYEKCGFRRVLEHKRCIPVEGKAARPGAQKLDIEHKDHLDLICRCASERTPVSNLLGVKSKELFMFWCLYYLKDNIYYVADLDLLVLCGRKEGVVTIFDIVGRRVPAFSEIYPYISSDEDRLVEFMFMTDKLALGEGGTYEPVEANGTHLMGAFPLDEANFIFPYTAHA